MSMFRTSFVLATVALSLACASPLLGGCASVDDDIEDGSDESVAAGSDALNKAQQNGVWISRTELMALPTTGAPFERVRASANRLSGSADLSDNNSDHDVQTLAAAYIATRTGDAAMRAKAIRAIETVYASRYERVLELSRNIQAYVIAADVIGPDGWDSARFKTFVRGLPTKALSGHSGGKNLLETAKLSANNWGCHARAALAIIGVYTGDAAFVGIATEAQRAFVSGQGGSLKFTSTNWHAGSPEAGINPVGATIGGKNVDGVIPEDQRRTGEFKFPAPKGSYPWEALQGTTVAGVVLDRAGALPFDTGSNAIVRAAKWLTVVNANPASGDDTWQPWLMNKFGKAGLSTSDASTGKNMGFTDWTHR